MKNVIGKYVLRLEKRLLADNIMGFRLPQYGLSSGVGMKKIGVVHLNSVSRELLSLQLTPVPLYFATCLKTVINR